MFFGEPLGEPGGSNTLKNQYNLMDFDVFGEPLGSTRENYFEQAPWVHFSCVSHSFLIPFSYQQVVWKAHPGVAKNIRFSSFLEKRFLIPFSYHFKEGFFFLIVLSYHSPSKTNFAATVNRARQYPAGHPARHPE